MDDSKNEGEERGIRKDNQSMKIVKAKVDNCNTFSFQCKKVRITLTHCPFLENGIDRCSIENRGIDDISKLQKWCPLEENK